MTRIDEFVPHPMARGTTYRNIKIRHILSHLHGTNQIGKDSRRRQIPPRRSRGGTGIDDYRYPQMQQEDVHTDGCPQKEEMWEH